MNGRASTLVTYYEAVPAVVRGMILMMIAALSVNLMNIALRYIANEIHVFEIGFIRHIFGFLFFVPVFMRSGTHIFITRRLGLLTLRAILNVAAMLIYYVAVMLIPLSEVMALGFTTPLFVTVLAVLILGERMNQWRWIGLGLGLTGALVILRPWGQDIPTGSLLILLSSSMWACALITIKILTRTESTLTITMYASLLQIPLSLVMAVIGSEVFDLFEWTWPTLYHLFMIFLIAVCGTLSHVCVAQAFKDADATVVMPVDFTKLVFAGIIGYLLFAEIPDIWTLVGGLIVFCGVIYIALRERNGARQPAA